MAEPTHLGCLQCQLAGRRRQAWAKTELCALLPRVLPLGPVLLAAWAVGLAAFFAQVR